MKLQKITAKNIKKLPDGEYDLSGKLVAVQGRNYQGKSTLLHLIGLALAAEFGVGLKNPLRIDEEEGEAVAIMQSGAGGTYELHLEVKGEKSKLYLVTPDGVKITKKGDIRKMLGDPPSLIDVAEVTKNQDTKAGRAKNLKEVFKPLLGVDPTEIQEKMDEIKGGLKDMRSREKMIQAAFKKHGITPRELASIPPKADLDSIKEALQNARALHQTIDEATKTISGYDEANAIAKAKVIKVENMVAESIANERESIDKEVKELQERIVALEEKKRNIKDTVTRAYANILAEAESASEAIDEEKEKAESFLDEVSVETIPDVETLEEEMGQVAEKNARIDMLNSFVSDGKELLELESKISQGTHELSQLEDQIQEIIAKAAENVDIPDRFQFGVDDEGNVALFFIDPDTGKRVLFSGEDVATSQMVYGSMALTIASLQAAGAKGKFITLKDASLLDSMSMKEVAEYAISKGYDLYPEIVTDEDGVIVEVLEA